MDVPEREYKNIDFEKIVKIVSPTWFEIEVWTHTRVPYLFLGQMVVQFEEVELSKTLENIVKFERLTFSDIVARPLVDWLHTLF